MVSSLEGKPLTEDDVRMYEQRGYLLYRRQLFRVDELEKLSSIFEEHRTAQAGTRGDEFDTPHFEDHRLLDFLLAPQVLDLVECIVGPDILLWSSHFICKDPLTGRATPWHEDSAYWMGRLDRYDKIVTLWLALDDVDRDNGCMQVIPGSHLYFGSSQYRGVDTNLNTFKSEIADIDVRQAVPFELRRGECSLHDGRIRHGAEPNKSNRRRLGYTMRYLSARVTLVPQRNAHHRTWLARGRALAANQLENA
jgi:ectoine hydroxylase-related dioxygenase (phytanoyl-CoA dioxygenase family)